MRIRHLLITVSVLVCVALAFVFTGCEESDSTVVEDADLTVEYLSGEYADQLTVDGAKTILGTISVDNTDGVYSLNVVGKEVVPSDEYDEGYYIAETNVVKQLGVGGYAKFVYSDGERDDAIGNVEDFEKLGTGDPDALYTIYYMNDKAELVLQVKPEDAAQAY